MNSDGKNLLFLNKQAENRLCAENKNAGGDDSPDSNEEYRNSIAFLYPVILLCPVVLPGKGIHSRAKALCGHPGNTFHLTAHPLNCHCCVSPGGNHSGQHHGNSGIQHCLKSRRRSHRQNPDENFPGNLLPQTDFMQQHRLPGSSHRQNKGNCHLCRNRGHSSSCCLHSRKGTYSKHKNRIQDHIHNKPYAVCQKRSPAVAHRRKQPCQCLIQKRKQNQAAGNPEINLCRLCCPCIFQAEKANQGIRIQIGNQGKSQSKQHRQLQGSSSICPCLLSLLLSQTVCHLNLSSHFGQHHNSGGKPGIHSGGSHCSYRMTSHPSNPCHIRQIVGGLNQGGCHNRQRKSCQRRKNMSVQ